MSQQSDENTVAPKRRRPTTDPTRLPVIAAVLAFVLPPVGAVLGHIGMRRTYWRRRLLWLSIIIGWLLTLVLASGYLVWDLDRSHEAAQQSRHEQADAQMREMIKQSDSYGKVDEDFCADLKTAVQTEVPQGMTSSDEVPDDSIAAYQKLADSTTPHAKTYANFVDYLQDVADDEDVSAKDQAAVEQHFTTATESDIIACLPLVDDRFSDLNE